MNFFKFLATNFSEIYQTQYYGNPLLKYLQSLGLILVIYFGLTIFKGLILKKLHKKNFGNNYPKLNLFLNLFVSELNPVFIFIVAAFLGIQNLILNFSLDRSVELIAVIIFIVYGATKAQKVLSFAIQQEIKKNKKESNGRADPAILQIVSFFGTLFLWIFVIIFILNLLNINAATLIGSLGITSIAIAFALQNVLSDIFASLSIYFDRPFTVGDFIVVGNDKGVVLRVGLKSTRLRTLQGEELIMSNKELTTVRIRNFKNLQTRRIEFEFNLSVETSANKLREIPSGISKIIEVLEICKFERANFVGFTNDGLQFEVVYFIKSSDYQTYRDIQQKINLEVKEMLETMEVKFKD